MDLVILENFLDNASFFVLLLTMLIYWIGTAFPSLTWFPTLGTTGGIIANLLIATLLGARWLEGGYFPLSNLYESLFFLAWGITTTYLIVESMVGISLIGVVTTPIAMAITAFATISLPSDMRVSSPLVPALKSNWLMMHVSVMMLSYSALMVGSVMAIAFLIITRDQDISLRGSSVGTGSYRNSSLKEFPKNHEKEILLNTNDAFITKNNLSPQHLNLADKLDNLSYRIIGLGFPLLTIGIIAGAVWANEAWGSYWSWDPKETWALITWLVFAAYLHARITKDWQGRRPAILAAGGFIAVWVCYLGVNLLGNGLHSYGWFL
ncbi:MAG: cytochrome c-type biogenesis protein CcsB [Candidatus Atelocyanobacterium thalassa isolate SIO64986]|uniref:Cytochrome c biogenesis protein CcsA n=1 Tax=Candidatus Atelocyanobacterium thalassa isolate SIO64986 TaxID=1527444 RepID=A0A086CGP5_9CHRO|nr:MAG: cytochrome c-type biogenesis protein CcsB [Candidatus Atelocyanobacterium thalassa isolate SIO64986]